MNITFYSYYNIQISTLCEDSGGTGYGNHLYYPMNVVCKILKEKGHKIVEPVEKFDLAIFLDLNENLYETAKNLSKKVKKILICIESPIFASFEYHNEIIFDDLWDFVFTYNRSYLGNKIVHYDIPITGNITNSKFSFSNKNALGVVVASFKNDNRGFIPPRRDKLLKFLANENEIELYGHGWSKSHNIHGIVNDKIEVMKKYSYALVIENCRYSGYVTEKLGDAILAGLPSIYYGDIQTAKRRFSNTFVPLDNLDYSSFKNAKEELFLRYDELQNNVKKEFLNSNLWIESFVSSVINSIDKL